MHQSEENGYRKTFNSEMFRWLTPIFLFILTGTTSLIIGKLNDIDDKLFRHLTNDELHSPRSLVMNKAEFLIYKDMFDSQNKQVIGEICEIKNYILSGEKRILKDKYFK